MKNSTILKLVSITFIMSLMFGLASCGVFQKSTDESSEQAVDKPERFEKAGAVLWGENCSRCHNAPNAGEFTEKQWETISMHMRIRANLTAEETEKIEEFLKQTY